MGKQCGDRLGREIDTKFGDLRTRSPYCQNYPGHDGDCHWQDSAWGEEGGAKVVRTISVSWSKKGNGNA